MLAFTWIIRQEIGGMGWPAALWRPAAAGVILLAALIVLWQFAPLVGLLLAPAIYGAALIALRPFRPEEADRIAPLLPGRVRRWALRHEHFSSEPNI
jgi:hypothetical protein